MHSGEYEICFEVEMHTASECPIDPWFDTLLPNVSIRIPAHMSKATEDVDKVGYTIESSLSEIGANLYRVCLSDEEHRREETHQLYFTFFWISSKARNVEDKEVAYMNMVYDLALVEEINPVFTSPNKNFVVNTGDALILDATHSYFTNLTDWDTHNGMMNFEWHCPDFLLDYCDSDLMLPIPSSIHIPYEVFIKSGGVIGEKYFFSVSIWSINHDKQTPGAVFNAT